MAEAKEAPDSRRATAQGYRVLARKYRPQTLGELVGQDVLVRTLTNAFQSGRIAHAYLLTGVRGVGKTTTARIIARAMNCTGPDGKGGPTVSPCGVCADCRAIADDRSVDVLEIDAASHTGVDDIRALTEGARYAPVSARTKVYILDEVHMLSKQAFNALLKTLEEPPPRVTFVFATTEARKLPLTILSRCQRFDLRRVEPGLLAQHLTGIAAKEGFAIDAGAAALLGRAADGSVRDGLSLLDQAMALAPGGQAPGAQGGEEHGAIGQSLVQEMLGLADRSRTLDLFDVLMAGDVPGALSNLREQYDLGADPVLVLQDLLDVVHWLTRLKAVPGQMDRNTRTAAEQERGRAVAAKVAMPVLARAWQMVLKGLAEAGVAPDPMAAVEMVLVRLAYVADLPSPADVVEKLTAVRTSAEAANARRVALAQPYSSTEGRATEGQRAGAAAAAGYGRAKVDPRDHPKPARPPLPSPSAAVAVADLATVVRLAGERGEPMLRAQLIDGVHLVSFAQGHIEVRLGAKAPKDLPLRLQRVLTTWTGRPWTVAVSAEPGAPTVAEQEASVRDARVAEAHTDPAVQAVLAAFPGAKIRDVRDIAGPDAAAAMQPAASAEIEMPENEPPEKEQDGDETP